MYVTKSTLLNQFFVFILLFSGAQSVKATEIIKLKCEHLINPIGIDIPNPRLSWIMDDDRKGALQKAYRITVGTDSLQLKGKTNIQWDTDQVNSGNNLATYKGRPLMPFTKYFWKVDVLDQNDKLISSKILSFETGMMGAENWKGTWISDGNDINTRPAPYFRNVFESAKQIKSARVYMVAAGLYELYLNGKKVGNHRLDPMYTRFDRKNLYVTYDVTSNIMQGKMPLALFWEMVGITTRPWPFGILIKHPGGPDRHFA